MRPQDMGIPFPVEELLEAFREVIDELPEREREIAKFLFGWPDGEPHSIAETAQRFGISEEMVRFVEDKALRRSRVRLAVKRIGRQT